MWIQDPYGGYPQSSWQNTWSTKPKSYPANTYVVNEKYGDVNSKLPDKVPNLKDPKAVASYLNSVQNKVNGYYFMTWDQVYESKVGSVGVMLLRPNQDKKAQENFLKKFKTK